MALKGKIVHVAALLVAGLLLADASARNLKVAVVSLSGGPSQDQAQTSQVVEVSDHHG